MRRIPWTSHSTKLSIVRDLKIEIRLSTTRLQRKLQLFGQIALRGDKIVGKLVGIDNVPKKTYRSVITHNEGPC